MAGVNIPIMNRYQRKPLYVDVVEVTAENMEVVAEWCGGRIVEKTDTVGRHVKVPVVWPRHNTRTAAHKGCFVLKTASGFKVYHRAAFLQGFLPVLENPRVKMCTRPGCPNTSEEVPETVPLHSGHL